MDLKSFVAFVQRSISQSPGVGKLPARREGHMSKVGAAQMALFALRLWRGLSSEDKITAGYSIKSSLSGHGSDRRNTAALLGLSDADGDLVPFLYERKRGEGTYFLIYEASPAIN